MSVPSTNKLKTNLQALKKSSQPDLHLKILNIVANRMNPVISNINQDRHICGSCITTGPSSNNISKKNSLTTVRAKQAKSKSNKTVFQPYQKIGIDNLIQSEHLQKQFIPVRKRKLQIRNNVIFFCIDHKEIEDITVDLRSQTENQFTNVKIINKLRQQNSQKSKRIRQLQHQILQLHQKIIELNLNLQIKSKAFSDAQIAPSINKISSVHETNNMQSRQATKVWIEFDVENINKEGEEKYIGYQNNDSQYNYLMRILKTQALGLQNYLKQQNKIQGKMDQYSKGI